ncbi:MAG: hypothetical protein KKB79_00160, partial [Nanoarchaeota archaeon]|nr:hypothetical protein [Nanoarchaeota archaeon]
ETKSINPDDIKRLIEDVALIKKVLSIDKIDSEGELTDWAKEELQKARLEKEVTSHEELKKELGL